MNPKILEGIDTVRKEQQTVHELKTWPCYFEAVLRGDKNFEIRYNKDRGFQKGDTVILKKYNPNQPELLQEYNEMLEAEISYVTAFEQKEGYVVFGLKNVREIKTEES